MICWAITFIGILVDYLERVHYFMYIFFSIIVGLEINCQKVQNLLQEDSLWNGSKPESPGACFLKRSNGVELRYNRICDFTAFHDC